ncbi:MAG: hypothetical protein ACYSW7_09905 [Planctomycetota bacterium]|jgi:hypothetical protein
MVLTHTNRKGDTYYLHQSLKAKRKFFFSKNKDGELVEKIPEGYEIYENPNGLVFLRKERPKVFSDEEIAIVENGMRDYTDLEFYKIDVKGNTIIILLPLQDVDAIKEAIFQCSFKTPAEINHTLQSIITFAPEMQLILTDKEKHLFSLKRYCYRGLGSWITLETSSDLKVLVKKYFKYLAKESFFDLFAEF